MVSCVNLQRRSLLGCVLVLGLSAWSCGGPLTQAVAQNGTLQATYGRGVHAYFRGDLSNAEQLFSEVIALGSKDPRVYYFRAMTLLRSGRQDEADLDMQIGAAFEALNPGQGSQVSRSLQRIQGPERRTLENFRREARMQQAQELRLRTQSRYERLRKRAPTVLHDPNPYPLDQLIENPSPITPAVSNTSGVTDEVTQPAVPEEAEIDMSQAPAEEKDLFEEAVTSTPAEPATDDLFGKPAVPAPAKEEAPAEEGGVDDLFGGSEEAQGASAEESSAAPTDDNSISGLFGEPATEEAPAEEAAEAPTADDSMNDLFGEPATEEAAAEETTEAPTADDSMNDFFGGPTTEEAPAEEATEAPAADDSMNDLFGEPVTGESPAAETPAEEASDTPAADDTMDDLFGSIDEAEATEDSAAEDLPAEEASGEASSEGTDTMDDLFGSIDEAEAAEDAAAEDLPAEEDSEEAGSEETDSMDDLFGDSAESEPAPEAEDSETEDPAPQDGTESDGGEAEDSFDMFE